jgi:hypothetical protein
MKFAYENLEVWNKAIKLEISGKEIASMIIGLVKSIR